MDNNNSVKKEETTETPKVETASATTTTETDAESKIAQLEAEKAKILKESKNWEAAFRKTNKAPVEEEFVDDNGETMEDKMRKIAREAMDESRLVEIAREQDLIIKDALKENKELKLAMANKTTAAPTSAGVHTESPAVQSTLVNKEQLDYFKSRNWNEKDIERYKKNLLKNSR